MAEPPAALVGREVAVVERRPFHDRFGVTRLYSRLLAAGMRRRGLAVRTIALPEPTGRSGLADAILDPAVAAIFLTAPIVELDGMVSRSGAGSPLRAALEAKRFVVQIGNPAFRPSSRGIAGHPLGNARFVHIDRDSLDYAADAEGSADRLAFRSLPRLVNPRRASRLGDRRRPFLFAATVRDPQQFRAAWTAEQPGRVALFDELVERIRPFDASAWRIAKSMLAARGLPFTVHDPVGARLLTHANDFVYHAGKRALLARIARYPVTYVIDGAPPVSPAPGSEVREAMPNDRLIALAAETRSSIWYPPNRMIGCFTSRVPNTLAVGAIPILGGTPIFDHNPEVAAVVQRYDHRFDGLEEAMERIASRPHDLEDVAQAGVGIAHRLFEPMRFVDDMLALAAR